MYEAERFCRPGDHRCAISSAVCHPYMCVILMCHPCVLSSCAIAVWHPCVPSLCDILMNHPCVASLCAIPVCHPYVSSLCDIAISEGLLRFLLACFHVVPIPDLGSTTYFRFKLVFNL